MKIFSMLFFMNICLLATISGAFAQNADNSGIYHIEVESIEGEKYTMAKYRGKVILIVNTASECGYTPQYKSLQLLHELYGKQGLVVLGVPCNQFGRQEPGTEAQIKKFCETRYGVTFPMLKKASVKGPDQHALYRYLLSHSSSSKDIAWNFEKFLVGRNGNIINRYSSSVNPLDDQLVSTLKNALENH